MLGPQGEAPTHGEVDLVQLDQEHPGFRDPAYRSRRNQIARLALGYRFGDALPRVDYTPQEHGVWKTALAHLMPLHARYACDAFRERWPTMAFSDERIPEFDEMNRVLEPLTGFGLVPVAGLVSPRVFMSDLAKGVFLATQYIRHHSAPLYTPEPDVVHELVGHAALLADERFAGVNRLFGEATLRADEARVQQLIRLYWYTLEFGVVNSPSGLKVVGAGLLSSFGELGRFEKESTLRPFELDEVGRTPFDPTRYQDLLFVAPSAAALLDALERHLSG